MYRERRSWKRRVAILAVPLVVLGGAAAYGVPRYLASQRRAVAAQQPDILVHTAPKSLGGQRQYTVAGLHTAAIAASLTSAGVHLGVGPALRDAQRR